MSLFRQLKRSTLLPRRAEHNPQAPILELSHVTVRYNGRAALADVSFSLHVGERIAVVGPNGAGKSTLFKVVAGVLPVQAGNVAVSGHRPSGHICIAYVPQRSEVDWDFPANVADVVMMGRVGKLGLLRWPKAADWALVRECLGLVGLAELAGRQIGELSGGQQQRMFIARALAQEAELMLMDEPLSGLDAPAREDIFRVLEELSARKVTVLIATHDLDLAASYFSRVVLLNGRLLGIGQPQEVFTPENLRAAYGGHMQLIETEDGLMVVGDTHCGKGGLN